jgi:large subunit ribosomal protein L9
VKIVLREDLENLGYRGDIVRVKPGYARNYLLPRGLALEATPGNLKVIEHQKKVWAVREMKEVAEARQIAARMGGVALSVTKKAGDTGTLYGAVTSSEIAALLASAGFEINRRKISLREPIKALGIHEVPIKLHREVHVTLSLAVMGEDGATGPRQRVIEEIVEPPDLVDDDGGRFGGGA